MPVCLHCGELGAPGALFCTKCGYTLPQGDGAAANVAATPPAPVPVSGAPPSGAPSGYPVGYPVVLQAVPYIVPASSVPGALGPVAPPPNAKFCNRCGTAIAQPAVYCPVCEQPQP